MLKGVEIESDTFVFNDVNDVNDVYIIQRINVSFKEIPFFTTLGIKKYNYEDFMCKNY